MTVGLDSALTGLRAAQQALDVTSTNIANASTKGYTRKALPQESLVIAGQGAGVKAGIIYRRVDNALISDINGQTSIAGKYTVINKYMTRIQDFHGATESGRALSSQLGTLATSFAELSNAPDNLTLINKVVTDAKNTTTKINNFGNLINTMRSDIEADVQSAVTDLNRILDKIGKYNREISALTFGGGSTAALEDQRDEAIKEVAKYIDINTSKAEGNQINVLTKQGETLADQVGRTLYFNNSTMLPSTYYPGGGLGGLRIGTPTGTDIVPTGLGGQIGALFDLRDKTLPQYTAQLDEFAQKLASRFESVGLRLFTDLNGNVPANVAPPALTGYTGFSSLIQVNPAVIADPTLIRNGTTGNIEQTGSNEVIRRVSEYALGPYQRQEAQGTVNISAGILVGLLGLTTQNVVNGNVNLSTYANFSTVPGLGPLPGTFTVTIAGVPQIITVTNADNSTTLVNQINTAFGAAVSGVNSQGQIFLRSNGGNVGVSAVTLSAPQLATLGLTVGFTAAPNSTFSVRVGTRPASTVTILPGDTQVQLLAQLNAIQGVTASLNGAGQLVISPTEGGQLTLIDGPGAPLGAMNVTTQNIAHTAFRDANLGPAANLNSGLLSNVRLQDYINSIITSQGEDTNTNRRSLDEETVYLDALEGRNANTSGVNIDQEMTDLIRIQSAYTAAAKVISASQKLFDDLLAAFR